MPWKVFTLSLALTNFGGKLANDQFIQRQKCLLLPKVYHHYSVPTILQVVTRICFRKKLFYYRF